MHAMDSQNQFKVFVRNWLIAASAVAIARTTTAPLERVKIILQTKVLSPQFHELQIEPYKNALDAFRRIFNDQGFLSFWRGNAVNLYRHFPSAAFSFAFNDFFKELLIGQKDDSRNFQKDRMWGHMLCGALAGITTITIVNPIVLCQTLITADLGSDTTERRYLGVTHCFKTVYSMGGIRALYTGYITGIIGMSLYRSVYFGLFASFKEHFDSGYGGRAPFVIAWSTAQVVTIAASACGYPFDTLSRTQQLYVLSSISGYRKTNPWTAVKYITYTYGIFGLYRGFMINILRTFGGALIIVAYDEIQYRFFTQETPPRKSFVVSQHEDTIRRTWYP